MVSPHLFLSCKKRSHGFNLCIGITLGNLVHDGCRTLTGLVSRHFLDQFSSRLTGQAGALPTALPLVPWQLAQAEAHCLTCRSCADTAFAVSNNSATPAAETIFFGLMVHLQIFEQGRNIVCFLYSESMIFIGINKLN